MESIETGLAHVSEEMNRNGMPSVAQRAGAREREQKAPNLQPALKVKLIIDLTTAKINLGEQMRRWKTVHASALSEREEKKTAKPQN